DNPCYCDPRRRAVTSRGAAQGRGCPRFCVLHQFRKPQGRGASRQPAGGLVLSLEIAGPADPHRRRGFGGLGCRGRRLCRLAAAQRLRLRATYASLGVALLLIAAKLVVWISTGSVALLSSLVDSMVDAAASLVTFFAVRHATVPADREHRFGHGKAEPLAALGQSAFLVGSAVLLLFEAVRLLV